MNAKHRRIRFAFAVALIFCVQLALILSFALTGKSENERRGIFSWKSAALKDGGKEIISFMKQYGFTELYQWFSSNVEDDEITALLDNANEEGILVYMLTGDPVWARDRTAKKMLEKVEQTAKINESSNGRGFKGIVFDVEPYLLSDWKKRSVHIMDNFVSGMKKAYNAASAKDLEVIICVPYYFDSEGFNNELKSLIRSACDRLAVMNYLKGEEARLIESEAKYTQRYEKGLINIYEFQPPGVHSLVEKNTYYNDGAEAVYKNFAKLRETYPDSGVIMAAHDYESLKEVLERK